MEYSDRIHAGANAELISSAYNLGSSSWVPRKGAVATDHPATAPFFVHSFGGNARDRDSGKAEPNRTTQAT